MAIVKQPLANRLFNAAQTGVSLWQGQQQAKAGKEFLKSTDGLQQYAPFVHPLTGEMGGVGKQMFDLYGAIQQQQARASAIAQQQAMMANYRDALTTQRQMMMANYRDQLEEGRFARKSIQDILRDLDDDVTIGPKGTRVKPGLLQTQFGIDPSTVSASDKRRIAERIYKGEDIDKGRIIPGQAAEEPFSLGPIKFGSGKPYQQTQFGF